MAQPRSFLKVLIAIDGSNESMRAADFGLSIAIKNEVELTLFYVFYSQLVYAYTLYLSNVEPSIDAILQAAQDHAARIDRMVINSRL